MRNSTTDTASLQTLISRVLTTGLALACAVVLLGGILLVIQHRGPAPDLSTFHPEPDNLRSLPLILRSAAAFNPSAIILLGALLLVATPIARVALAMVLFAIQRDRLYVVISAILLAILLISLA